MAITLRACNDVSEQAASLEGWRQDYVQLEKGRYSGELLDIQDGAIRLFREGFSLSISQCFHAPEDQWHLVMPLGWSHGGTLGPQGIYLLPRCERFRSAIPGGFETIVLSVPREGHAWLAGRDHELRRLAAPAQTIRLVRHRCVLLTSWLKNQPPLPSQQTGQALFRQVRDCLALLSENQDLSPVRDEKAHSNSRYIVDRCHGLIEERLNDPPSIMELCQKLRISRRTLQYSFQSETGVQPLHYIRSLRLNVVRRRIISEPTLPLASIAAELGFFHMSYFAQEYRRLFNEPPSQTQRRSMALSKKAA